MENFNKKFPASNAERKTIIENAGNEAREFVDEGLDGFNGVNAHEWKDSPLDGDDEPITFFDSFKNILPEGEHNLRAYIEKVLETKKSNAVGVEFGGTGLRLFDSFTSGFFKKSAGVTLVNYKKLEDSNNQSSSHVVVEGSILSSDLYPKLNKELNNDKVDLIIERMGAGFRLVPEEPRMLSNIFSVWYQMLSENGLMLIQTPVAFNNLLEKWVPMIQEKFAGVLEIQYNSSDLEDGTAPGSVLRIRKLPGAPEKLPFLDSHAIRESKRVEGKHI